MATKNENNNKTNNKKNKENKKMRNNKKDPMSWNEIPLTTWSLDLTTYAVPPASLGAMVVMSRALAGRVLINPTPGQVAARERMAAAAGLCAQAISYNSRLPEPRLDQRKARMWLVRLVISITGMIDLRTQSPDEEVAEEAAQLRVRVFGNGFDPMKLDSRTLLLTLQEVEGELRDKPELRAELEQCVPPKQLARLFKEAKSFGARWRAEKEAKAPPLNLQALKGHLRQRTAEYVANVLGSVNASEPASVAAVNAALLPLTELRAELAVQRARVARKKKAKASEAEFEEEEEPGLEEDAEEADEAEPEPPAPTTTDD